MLTFMEKWRLRRLRKRIVKNEEMAIRFHNYEKKLRRWIKEDKKEAIKLIEKQQD